jgi:hypothetical protein
MFVHLGFVTDRFSSQAPFPDVTKDPPKALASCCEVTSAMLLNLETVNSFILPISLKYSSEPAHHSALSSQRQPQGKMICDTKNKSRLLVSLSEMVQEAGIWSQKENSLTDRWP